MEHAIHCISWAFVKEVCLTPMVSIRSKLATDEDNNILKVNEKLVATGNTTDGLLNTEEFNPTDLLGKTLAFINQVYSSLQACVFFYKLYKDKNLLPLQLLKWSCTCGLHYMISLPIA